MQCDDEWLHQHNISEKCWWTDDLEKATLHASKKKTYVDEGISHVCYDPVWLCLFVCVYVSVYVCVSSSLQEATDPLSSVRCAINNTLIERETIYT